jgi:hypothetical protein
MYDGTSSAPPPRSPRPHNGTGADSVLTLAQFVRHAEKFGPELVVETAAGSLSADELAHLEAEIALLGRRNGKPARSRQRRTTDALREQVLVLRDRGLLPTVIADTLNVSDRRVQTILAESRRSENGAGKRLNHAGGNAAKAVARPAAHPGRQAAPEPAERAGRP